MGRVLLVVLLLSFSLAAQTSATSAPATAQQGTSTVIPAHVNLDPPPPIIYSANAPLMTAGPDPSVVPPAAPTNAGSVTSQPVVSGGYVSYTIEKVVPLTSTVSVADAAAQYRTNKTGMSSRVIDNNSLSVLDRNPSGLVNANESTMPQGDISPEEEAALRNAKPEFAAAGDVLDPRDLAAVEAAIRRSEKQHDSATEPTRGADVSANPVPENQNAGAQYEQMTQDADAQAVTAGTGEPRAETPPQATPDDARPQSDVEQRDRLPESSSALPFLALLGFIAAAGGAASMVRARA